MKTNAFELLLYLFVDIMTGESRGGGRGKGWFSDCVKNDFEPKKNLSINFILG